jgi:hypothetical protein
VIRHLLVIGAQRCGTTYLHAMLDAHEQITMARPANPEPKVFCSDEATRRGAAWYRETYFAHAGAELLLGEKSTSYLEDPKAPARAAEMLGDVHVLAILRDPVERAISNWRFSTDNGFETRDLETALTENLAGSRPWDPSRTSVSPFAYLERGRYVDYLGPWTSTFPETSQVLFLDELLRDGHPPDGFWAALGVAPDLAPRSQDRAVNQSPGEPPVLSNQLLGTLRAYFEKSNGELSAHLGRDLPW